MAGNTCKICASAELSAKCASLVAAGLSDAQVAAQLGAGATSRAAVGRHRRQHLLPVTRKLTELAARDAPAKAQRQEIMAAADAGDLDPSDYLSVARIVGDLRRIGERLERVAAQAESAEQPLAVSSLAGQQIRLNETRGKLGGVGAYGSQKQNGAEAPIFSLTINFGAGRAERIEMMALDSASPPAIDMQPGLSPEFTTVVGVAEREPRPANDDQDDVIEEDG